MQRLVPCQRFRRATGCGLTPFCCYSPAEGSGPQITSLACDEGGVAGRGSSAQTRTKSAAATVTFILPTATFTCAFVSIDCTDPVLPANSPLCTRTLSPALNSVAFFL